MTTRYLTVLVNDGTACPLNIDEDELRDGPADIEAAATINLRILETRGDFVMKFEVGGIHGSQLFAVNFSKVVSRLIADQQTEDGRFPDPDDAIKSLELLARRLEFEAALLRSKLANAMFEAGGGKPDPD